MVSVRETDNLLDTFEVYQRSENTFDVAEKQESTF